ncbi:ABC-2 type transport system ATP-binding protein [Pseudobutyrivibrio sp. NOR37]|uniref:ABC transporter ATP-binding protein n=1 Tax=Pseudobutyrivibrio xylanivorans TaxID=185007 RepID=A0A6M0LI64_PSEXY|nr:MULTISPECIES: ABC transporter ATP-binding protein [Pseudobutyrivibrio]NEX00601.1 ABC transporter ATP-binding protein [Pseudobutyrivibrio xylanivorans]SFR61350.1 ABC-2 type transport system ATP-binding protein [Pseudobutyrivibrio sp. NOR37]
MKLESINVTKKFPGKVAIENISMTLEPGHIYALLGPNGSGKTTWMKTVAGLIKATSGEVKFNDVAVNTDSRKKIAYMSTEPYFYDWMTVGDVGKYYQDFFDDFSMEKYDELLAGMNLDKKLKIKTLSSGMMAKLKIAVTMGRNADVYMLDEPLNGIDLIARDEVMRMVLTSASEDNIMIISSHLVEELEALVDRAIFIQDGHFAGMYDVEQLRVMESISLADKYREVYSGVREA